MNEFKNAVAKFLDEAGIEYETDVTFDNVGEKITTGKVTLARVPRLEGVGEAPSGDELEEAFALETKMNKLRKKLPPELVEELEQMDEADLRKRIVTSECNLHETQKAKEADKELNDLKYKVKEASAPFAEAKKLQTAIIQYATCVLDKQGKI